MTKHRFAQNNIELDKYDLLFCYETAEAYPVGGPQNRISYCKIVLNFLSLEANFLLSNHGLLEFTAIDSSLLSIRFIIFAEHIIKSILLYSISEDLQRFHALLLSSAFTNNLLFQ